ncbi:SPOR domain-containing protein [Ferrimonas marina]|uniref:DedD protein n=1 Tax=Ferrimonas marina TaxID=299255 RepID=A0A1M5Y993_9GAMM|nr:SPOR domain-containing protein [Ferrimonas marina]SHI08607.1 DedD protein [Ferrimonas marina]
MAQPIQNRLVGTLVLVALGVLFLPDMLNGEKKRVEEQFATIPLRPSVAESTLPEQALSPLAEAEAPVAIPLEDSESKPVETAQLPATTEVEVTESAQAEPTPKPKPKAVESQAKSERSGWSIRLGSFRSASNVNRLVKDLRAQDYPAYTVPAKPVDGQITVVFVGPDIDKSRIEALQRELAEEHALQTQLVRYNPLQI